ncbi:hypothetical protein A7K91_14335 [Paenibacillus oryzae]|uniref:WG repeat-containing protein n=1 Tax=Paenibacillus oryzae TaxID=1844972 RepID=A0A1A5YJE4_9BACL|nr:WG repeat-containing protein [Paenibacillus oryzae]OBR65736.1 hypothetical protein A7K91_14335 [Paenibacillus oryzae]
MNRLLKTLVILAVSSFLAIHSGKVVAETENTLSFAIPPKYDYAGPFSDDLAVIALEGQLGMINKEGKEIVRPYYDRMVDAKGRSLEVDDYFTNDYWIAAYLADVMGLDEQMKDVGNPANLFSEGLAIVVKNGLFGYINRDGYEVVKPQYLYAGPFQDGVAVVLTENGYGFIDAKGSIVISPEYKGTYMYQDDVVLMITQNEQTILFDRKGNELALFNEELKLSPYNEGLALVYDRNKEKYGYANPKGKLVIEPRYDRAAFFSEGLALVQREDRVFYVNAEGKEVIELMDSSYYAETGWNWDPYIDIEPDNWYYNEASEMDPFAFQEGLALFVQDGKYGFINTKGKEVVPPQYEQAAPYRNGLAKIIFDNKYGYLNIKGELVVEPQYDYAFQYEDGMIRIVADGKAGFLNEKGKLIAEPRYDENHYNDKIPFLDNLRMVSLEGQFGYIDKSGNEVVKPQYNAVSLFMDGMAAVMSDGRVGFIDKTGQEIIRPYYDETTLSFFSEGVAVVKVDGKFGMINKKEVIVLPIKETFEDLYPVIDGMAAVQVNGLWGYMASPVSVGGSPDPYIVFAIAGVMVILLVVAGVAWANRRNRSSKNLYNETS